jgi:hypothetical protein
VSYSLSETALKYLLIIVAALGTLGWPAPGKAGWFGPSDYDECILESMKGVTSDDAASHIARSCRRKFPPSANQEIASRPLLKEEKEKLTIIGEWSKHLHGYWYVQVHNGNQDVTISRMEIKISSPVGENFQENVYRAHATIKPNTKGSFLFDVLTPNSGFKWYVVDVRGY